MSNYLIAVGPPHVQVSEIDIDNLQSQAKVAGLTVEDYLNRQGRLASLVCFCCHRGVKDPEKNDILLGLPIRLLPTAILEEEKKRQSDWQKSQNKKEKEKKEIKQFEKTYDPFAAGSAPDNAVKEKAKQFSSKDVRLKCEFLPPGIYFCRDCRLAAGDGGQHESRSDIVVDESTRPPTAHKFLQTNFRIASYRDEDGKTHNITDRLTFILNQNNKVEFNLVSQLALMTLHDRGWRHFMTEDESSIKPDKQREFACMMVRAMSVLMKSASELMMKTGQSQTLEFDDFEKALATYCSVLRIGLYFTIKYPQVRGYIQEQIMRWAVNAETETGVFASYLDVLFACQLVHVPLAAIRHRFIGQMLRHLLHNFQGQRVDKDRKTYLRQLFHEGRNVKLMRQFLFQHCFMMMQQLHSPEELVTILDLHYCALPQDDCMLIWRNMRYCNEEINSFAPEMGSDGKRRAGFWLHIGMLPGDAGLEDEEIEAAVDNFLTELAKPTVAIPSSSADEKKKTPPLQWLSVTVTATATERKEQLDQEYDKFHRRLRELHSGVPKPSSDGTLKFSQKVCGYCGKKAQTGRELSRHVAKCLPVPYTPFQHSEHARVNMTPAELETWVQINPSIILKCPSNVCDRWDTPFTSADELHDHLVDYGALYFRNVPKKMREEDTKDTKGVEAEAGTEELRSELKTAAKDKSLQLRAHIQNPGTCVICIDSSCDSVFAPCGHVCCCVSCAEKLSKPRTCVICRVPIQESFTLLSASRSTSLKLFFASDES